MFIKSKLWLVPKNFQLKQTFWEPFVIDTDQNGVPRLLVKNGVSLI
jgi:hypothetical protein